MTEKMITNHNFSYIFSTLFIALGSQNCFSSAAIQTRNLHLFDEEDFGSAWKKVIGADAKFAQVSQIGNILRVLFRGPIPPADQLKVIY